MLTTTETRFGPAMLREIESGVVTGETAEALRENPHLWPFYLYRTSSQAFLVPDKRDSPVATVVVVHGNWRIGCPFCPSGQHASVTDPWFFCARCLNADAWNCSIPAPLPDGFAEIEQALMRRPWVTSRNWEPGETIDDLLRENEEHL